MAGVLWVAGLLFLASPARGTEPWDLGPLYDEFDLTIGPGHRTEALGPLFYEEMKDNQHIWAVPPLLSSTRDPVTGFSEFNFLYPVLTYDRYGDQYRWQFCQVFSFAGGPHQMEPARDRFTLFPIYFQQRSSDPTKNYTAVFPFYGHLRYRLFRDDLFFIMFPVYGQTRKKDVVTDNYFYPFYHQRHGDGLEGWQLWPLAGHEHKAVTLRTNTLNEVRTVPGHDKLFVMWPLFFDEKTGMGTENPQWQQSSIPAYSILRSPQRDSTTVLWPFFSYVDDREKKYHEWELPWPLIVFARGEGKNTTRVWPFYSRAKSPTLQSDFYMWPIYKYNRAQIDALDRERMRILFFLYGDRTDKNVQTGASRRRIDLWPLFTHRRGFDGNTSFQVLSLIEPFLAGSHKIERDYSHVWALWRSERNAKTKATSQSLLWNLYRREKSPDSLKCSACFGLFQYQAGSEGKRLRLFFIPLSKTKAKASAPPSATGAADRSSSKVLPK